jgi:hypothetical protein
MNLFEEMRIIAAAGDAVSIANNPPPALRVWYLDHCPVAAAKALPDNMLQQALVETTRLLCNAWVMDHDQQDMLVYEWGSVKDSLPDELNYFTVRLGSAAIYRLWHPHCPAAVWVRETAANYEWLAEHGLQLLEEHLIRFKKPHYTRDAMQALSLTPTKPPAAEMHSEPPVLGVKVVVVDGFEDAVQSYRNWLQNLPVRERTYTRQAAPSWLATTRSN